MSEHHVLAFGRMNPVTSGHEAVVKKIHSVAAEHKADHTLVVSHSQDKKKNPLSPEQKVKHAKNAFPNANVEVASEDEPSILNQASKLHGEGAQHLHVVVGQDRVAQFQNLLQKYNGQEGPHGYFNFDNINVHSAGGRDPDAEGVEGVSGTGQRIHARNNNFEGFRAGAPSRMTDEQAASLMNDIRNAKPPEPEEKPKPKTKKKLKEDTAGTVSGGEMVRGFGDVSGNPAVQNDPLQQYIDTNALAKDNENGFLMKMMKDSKHDLLGFKAFDPKELEKAKRKK